jgi:hypothetical protein
VQDLLCLIEARASVLAQSTLLDKSHGELSRG